MKKQSAKKKGPVSHVAAALGQSSSNGKRQPKVQLKLPSVMTGPEVQELLGRPRGVNKKTGKARRPISHVALIGLVEAGKLRRIGKATQPGGGYLYDSVEVKALAKKYKPQTNRRPAPAKTKALQRRQKSEGRVDEDKLSWLVSVPAGDVNFKSNLKGANAATVRAALRTRAVRSLKGKRKTLEARLRALTT
jgi:hypothetical protein